MKYGLCCISLNLKEQGYSFQTMTYKRFAGLPREEALEILGERILNNLLVTNEHIRYCHRNNWVYRLSSDIFPLLTYEKANVDLTDLPNCTEILDAIDLITKTIEETGVRISAHPDQFNVLASTNEESVQKTIDELNFFSSFMDCIGCSSDHNSPINIHINNKQGSYEEIIDRFMSSFNRLDPNCRNRLVIENDDKSGGWSVQELLEHFHSATSIPITFDYLHNKCNPSSDQDYTEELCVKLCYYTWQGIKPLFHYSESKEGNNPRAHADYAYEPFNTYGLDFDVDMELKQKDLAIAKHEELYNEQNYCQNNQESLLCLET
jgi:UV DNA damage endonuclease